MLAQYIIKSGKNRTQWAARLGISKSYLSEILNQNRTPSLDLAVKIEAMTEGAVSCKSWIDGPTGPDQRQAVA